MKKIMILIFSTIIITSTEMHAMLRTLQFSKQSKLPIQRRTLFGHSLDSPRKVKPSDPTGIDKFENEIRSLYVERNNLNDSLKELQEYHQSLTKARNNMPWYKKWALNFAKARTEVDNTLNGEAIEIETISAEIRRLNWRIGSLASILTTIKAENESQKQRIKKLENQLKFAKKSKINPIQQVKE